jgi:DNA-binding MarR family transcriptional regulator
VSTPEKPADEPLAKLLWRAHHWFRLAVTTGLEAQPVGVSPAHATLLSQIDPEGVPMSDLARLIGVTTSATHQMVHQLADLGFLKVEPNPLSKRSKLVVLTPEGHERRRQALELLAELEAELGQRIGKRRVSALRDALEQDWGEFTAAKS